MDNIHSIDFASYSPHAAASARYSTPGLAPELCQPSLSSSKGRRTKVYCDILLPRNPQSFRLVSRRLPSGPLDTFDRI